MKISVPGSSGLRPAITPWVVITILPTHRFHPEGSYLLQTEETRLTAREAVAMCKELADVERGFLALRDPIGLRPIWHQTQSRVRAHIFVAGLSFLLQPVLERRRMEKEVGLSAVEALRAFQTVRRVRFRIGGDAGRVVVTHGSPRAQQVLAALRISGLCT